MTKKEIIELYLADLNNLVPNSDAKRSRIIDLEDELEALLIHDIAEQKQHLIDMMRGDEELGLYEEPKKETLEDLMINNGYHDKDFDDIWREGVKAGNLQGSILNNTF